MGRASINSDKRFDFFVFPAFWDRVCSGDAFMVHVFKPHVKIILWYHTQSMSLLNDLRTEYRRLFAERNLLDVKIAAVEAAIAAYAITAKQAEDIGLPHGYDVIKYLREVFAETGNTPMKLRAIIDKVMTRYPSFSETKVKNRIMYIASQKALIKMTYGMYKFNMDYQMDRIILEMKPEDDPLFEG